MPFVFRALILPVLAATACAPRLNAVIIEAHPRVTLESPRIETVKASAKTRPAWCGRPTTKTEALVSFRGMASAEKLEEAIGAARRDVEISANRFAGVRIKTALSSEDTNDTSKAHEETRTITKSAGVPVKHVAVYWEEVRSSAGGPPRYLCWALGEVEARALTSLEKSAADNITVTTNDRSSRAIENELRHRLDTDRDVRVAVSKHADTLSAQWVILADDAELANGSVSSPTIFDLEDRLVLAIQTALTSIEGGL